MKTRPRRAIGPTLPSPPPHGPSAEAGDRAGREAGRAELLGHAVVAHPVGGELGRPLQAVGRPGRGLAESEDLARPPAEADGGESVRPLSGYRWRGPSPVSGGPARSSRRAPAAHEPVISPARGGSGG